MIRRLLNWLTLSLWSWRLRNLLCTRCFGYVDRIEIHATDGSARRITAHCPACNEWDDWRRDG